MDPIAHTLVGASLAETPLKRLSTLATPTLILAANAPDIDAVTLLLSRDVSLGFRRGWTHGILAMVILPLLLAGLMLLFDRLLGRYRQHQPRARAGPLIALSYIGVLTHTPLDWLNTYGIRFLMPFDGRWFYGDALFIVDPWIWLLAGAAVVLAHTRTVAAIAAWLALGAVSRCSSLASRSRRPRRGYSGLPASPRSSECERGAAPKHGYPMWRRCVWRARLRTSWPW